ncbi:Outer membrane cobalamin receptor protein [Sphingobacterium spiritivorum]|nr:Outer membrane cobalamin receptor protein [Sphingobacterium spiritivorum]
MKITSNYGNEGYCRYSSVRKILIVMKLITLFMVAALCQVQALTHAQLVTLKGKNARLTDILKEIKKQTKYDVISESGTVDRLRVEEIDLKRVTLNKGLSQLLAPFALDFVIEDKAIVIRRSSVAKMTKTENTTDVQTTIKGKVSGKDGQAIKGATVQVKNTREATATKDNGEFEITASPGDLLMVSSVGFVAQEVSVQDRGYLTVVLDVSNSALDEVVVVGYGEQKRKDVLGAISTVTSEDFDDRPSTNLGYSMEGKSAGVMITRPSGKPQNGMSVRVRGTNSITAGSNPLYIVDGVPTQLIYDINPNDIESVSVLKDAASAAIYGASGANGVILITTKRGKEGTSRLKLSGYTGFSRIAKKMDVLDRDQYISLMNEIGQVADWSKYTANTNWSDEVFRVARLQNYQMTVEGGNAKTKYYLSGAYSNENGVVKTNLIKRGTVKMNLDQKVNDWLSVGTSISYARWFDKNIIDNSGSGNAGVIMNVLTSSPVIGIYNEDGTFTANPLRLSFNNPVAYIDGSVNGYNNNRFYGNIFANIDLLKNLRFRSMFGYDNYNSKYNYFLDPFKTDWGRVNRGIANLSNEQSEYWLSENTLEYKQTFQEKHNLEVLGGVTSQRKYGESSSIESKGFNSTAVQTVNGGTIFTNPITAKSQRSNISIIGRIRYSFDDKYLLSSNFRADASSVFGPDNRWGYFPSFSAGWRLSQENFLKDVSAINDLKIRYSWGQVGNDAIGAYSWYGIVSPGINMIQGGQVVAGTGPSTPENTSLKWEASTQNNLGLDVTILDNRLTFAFDVYHKKTKNLLLNKPLALSSGFTGALQNIGDLENKGLELTISSKNLKNKLVWNTDFNFSLNRNKVGYTGGQDILDGYIPLRQEVSLIREGLPLGVFWGYRSLGVDPATGMMKYEDLNNDGSIDDADKMIIGNPNPKFAFGLNNNFRYKNFGLSFFLQGISGNDVFNATRIETEGMNDFKNQSVKVLNRWTAAGQQTDIPKAIYGDVTNSDISSRFVENGSYMRLKSATFSYSFPTNLLNKLKIAELSCYLTGENIFTVTRYSGYDPESSAYGNNGAFGIDFGTYPQARQFIFGVNLTF